MKRLTTEAIILKRVNFGEADRILTVITTDNGKVSMLAKGVRRPKSKLAGGLELFSISDVTYIDGKSDLKTVVSTRLKTHLRHIVEDVDRTMAAYDFIKVADSYAQHADDTPYFDLLAVGLRSLDDMSVPSAVSQVWYFTQVLRAYGSGVNVEKPLQESKFAEDKLYSFSYDDMSFFAQDNGEFRPQHIKFLRLVARSSKPEKLIVVQGSEELSADLVEIIKQAALIHKA